MISNTEQAHSADIGFTTHQASYSFTIIICRLHEKIIYLLFSLFFFFSQLCSSYRWFCKSFSRC